MTKRQKDYKEWLIRVKNERDFCEQLFRDSTIRLLCFKYAYYIKNKSIVKDITYDGIEQGWYLMGRGLKHLKTDETSPCVGFDFKHPLALEGIKLYTRLK